VFDCFFILIHWSFSTLDCCFRGVTVPQTKIKVLNVDIILKLITKESIGTLFIQPTLGYKTVVAVTKGGLIVAIVQ